MQTMTNMARQMDHNSKVELVDFLISLAVAKVFPEGFRIYFLTFFRHLAEEKLAELKCVAKM